MDSTNQRKQVFANLQDLLASLPEKERFEFRKYLEKHEIIGNQTLEPIVLFQYNAALFVDAALERLNTNLAAADNRIANQKTILDGFWQDFESAIESKVNFTVATLNAEIEKTVQSTNEQVGKLNTTVVNLVDNISAYIDTAMSKMLDQVADEKTKNINEITAFVELIKEQLKSEIQMMIVEIVKQEIPAELKKSVKQPIATHLQNYLEIVKKRTANLDNAVQSNELWGIKRLVRDFVVTGGAIFVLKLLHFI